MAANNSTDIPLLDGLSIVNVTNSTLASPTFLDKLAGLPNALVHHKELFFLEARIVAAALGCIYIASYGALRRPPSAKLPAKGKKDKNGKSSKHEDDSDDKYVQGLLPSDAIMFPILAGCILVGLYYTIKWLEDPDILNKCLQFYFSAISLGSLGKLFGDCLHFVTGFVFPTVWRDSNGGLHHVDSTKKGQWHAKDGSGERVEDNKKKTPFPGRFSELQLADSTLKLVWEIRRLLLEQWTVVFFLHGIVKEEAKVKFNSISGFLLAVAANLFYYTTNSPLVANVMGYGLSYAGIIVMSPTTFATGTAVLAGLFFYDILMVFYTPYMVTVATKLDVPIKLTFQGPTRASMLGLGDIVIPGIFVALCLRFDQYMYYRRQQQVKEVELDTEEMSSGQLIRTTKLHHIVVKPDYVNPQGQWGDRFWATKLTKIFSPDATPALRASAFPKPYFRAALVGYLLGMVATLAMLITFNHAQPALLYLVPGVVISLWLTAVVRGELGEMWKYTEDGSLDKSDVIVEVDGEGNVVKEVEGDVKKQEEAKDKKDEGGSDADREGQEATSKEKVRYPVFVLSIEAPARD
ncbi:signal peptide peptidase-domain-containing protein [Xylariaceae sp. FL0594]|nr:signal peptide peptidase-domain-containing protein [Xylariaceae sp. FL0594]